MGLRVKKEENFSLWFTELLERAGIVDKRLPNSRGFYAYPPHGTIIMKRMETLFEEELEKRGHKPIRTPTVIPMSLFELEKEHAGFTPEVWQITRGREGKKLEVPKGLRPTGETIIYSIFKYWIRSYRDLPFKTYETRSVFRAEPDNAIFPLFRCNEFYWIEAHDVQRNNEEADAQVREDMEIFNKVAWDDLSLPFMLLKRPEWDKFPGAEYSCAYDAPMPDGRVLQIATTHNLGQKFSRPFEIMYLDEDGKRKFAYQTCFGPGISRIMGAVIAIHSDNNGLVLPFKIAPIQFVIIPILEGKEDEKLISLGEKVMEILNEFSVFFDKREEYTPGWKFNEWELKGVPFRIEIGRREIENSEVTIVDRMRAKKSVKIEELKNIVEELIEEYDKKLKERAKEAIKIEKAENFKEILERIRKGNHFVEIAFCENEECVEKLKEENIKVRGIPLFREGEKDIEECEERSKEKAKGKNCAVCGGEARKVIYVARQY